MLISSAFVLSLVLLESFSHALRGRLNDNLRSALDSVVVFGMLWLTTLALAISVTSLAASFRTHGGAIPKLIGLLIRIFIVALVSAAWGNLLIDQLPCFVGVQNCD